MNTHRVNLYFNYWGCLRPWPCAIGKPHLHKTLPDCIQQGRLCVLQPHPAELSWPAAHTVELLLTNSQHLWASSGSCFCVLVMMHKSTTHS